MTSEQASTTNKQAKQMINTKAATYFVITIIISLLLNGCNQQKNQPKNERLNRWLDYYGLALHDFNDTILIENNSFLKTPIDTANIHFKMFNDFYIYSVNHDFLIDLDSYFLVIENNAKGELVCRGTAVDQEVALIDIKNEVRQRIIFCGTACFAEEAQWMDNETIYILGFSEPEKKSIPVIWVFNRKNNQLKELQALQKPIINKAKSYHKNIRLDKIVFD